MRKFVQFIGTVVFFCAWPAFWAYFKLGHGRTRVILMHEGRVLVMKQWISPGKWQLPGGGVHAGESMPGGAAREVYEETRLRLDPRQLQPVGKAVHRQYGLSFGYYVFATGVGSDVVRAQCIEVSELEWIHPAELHEKNTSPDALKAIQMAREKRILLQ